jgi:dTDP-4-amino-4,6-dideoxygalactose transaminase
LLDIDRATYNIDVEKVTKDVNALVAVHYAGLPMDLGNLPHRPRWIIEDASHALGAMTPDGPVGNCRHSDMTIFSFHPVKPITTGEGGMVTTNNDELAARLRRFRSQGIDRTPHEDAWMYDAVEVGYNYRLTDIQAALGISQLGRLGQFLDRRNHLANRYRELLKDLPVGLPPAADIGFRHGYHLFAIHVERRREVFRHLRDHNIGVQVHYVPVHHHSVSADIEIPAGGFPVADEVYAGLISMPMYPELTDEEQDYVVETLAEALSR